MPLPKISTPSYELVIPSTKKKVKFRPFLVKEEKILILAMESQNNKQIANAVKDVISSCITTRGVKVENLATFDIEYLFLNIRGKSVGEDLDVNIICPDDKVTEVKVNISLDDIKCVKDENHTNKIKLDDNLMMELKYPSLDEFIKTNFDMKEQNQMEQSFDLIAQCIDKVYNEDEVWATEDCTKKELNEFLESMNSSQFKEIEGFFTTMPKLTHKFMVTNPKTKVESEVVLEGLASFFA